MSLLIIMFKIVHNSLKIKNIKNKLTKNIQCSFSFNIKTKNIQL